MNVQFGQLQMDSLDGATVVNRNIEAGRGQARMFMACCGLTYARFAAHIGPALSQEMLHGRHDWPMMLVQRQHGARAVK